MVSQALGDTGAGASGSAFEWVVGGVATILMIRVPRVRGGGDLSYSVDDLFLFLLERGTDWKIKGVRDILIRVEVELELSRAPVISVAASHNDVDRNLVKEGFLEDLGDAMSGSKGLIEVGLGEDAELHQFDNDGFHGVVGLRLLFDTG